jgi:hypothetical protein
MRGYDIIGDIHGHAEALIRLLEKLGYKDRNGYEHPRRRALFLGDLIDRGPEVRQVLQIVKRMADKESAHVVLGNHEYNIICFFTKQEKGYLREHSTKNKAQVKATLQAFNNSPEELLDWLEWLKTLPLFYENDNMRAVHAAWDQQKINYLKEILPGGVMSNNFLFQSAQKDTYEHDIIEMLLKGQEIPLPFGANYTDKDGHIRSSIRVQWWNKLRNKTYQEVLFPHDINVIDIPIKETLLEDDIHYATEEKPVFFGHYWMNGAPRIQQKNVACLDYSIANCGKLVGYRFDGETELSEEKFMWVK